MPSCHICGKAHADLDSAGYCCYERERASEKLKAAFAGSQDRDVKDVAIATAEDNTQWLVYNNYRCAYMVWVPNAFITDLMPNATKTATPVIGRASADRLAATVGDCAVTPYTEVPRRPVSEERLD